MNYLNGNKKCLAEILAAVTPEDEKTSFLGLEYVKHYKGTIIGQVCEDGYGNECDLFSTVSVDEDPEWAWSSFKEAKKTLEKNGPWKVFHLKKGIKIAFEHEMVLPDAYCSSDTLVPEWVRLYGQWYSQMGDYRMRFATKEELEQKSEFIKALAKGAENAIKKH